MSDSEAADNPLPTSDGDSCSKPGKSNDSAHPAAKRPTREIGGQAGPEPTRFGDWERNGRCTDF
jgi:hypothetical protein